MNYGSEESFENDRTLRGWRSRIITKVKSFRAEQREIIYKGLQQTPIWYSERDGRKERMLEGYKSEKLIVIDIGFEARILDGGHLIYKGGGSIGGHH